MIVGILVVITVTVVIVSAKSDSLPQAVGRSLAVLAMIVVAYFGVKWAFTEYYITTHCTEVLGTRVCQ